MSNKKGRGAPPPPKKGAKPRVSGAPSVEPFPLKPGAMIAAGIAGVKRTPVPLVLGAALPFLISMPLLLVAQSRLESVDEFSFSDSGAVSGMALYLLGVVLAGTLSYPACYYALHAAREESIDLVEPFRHLGRFRAMAIASFWFWAGILLGLSFFVLPAVLIFVFYVFYGFVLVDRPDLGGLKALGTSVRIGDKRRIAMFGLAVLFGALMFLCFMPIAYGFNPAVALSIYVLLSVGTAASLVSWATLYDVLRKDLPDAW